MVTRFASILALLTLVACGDDAAPPGDGGGVPDGFVPADAGGDDAALDDGGRRDAGPRDGGGEDAGPPPSLGCDPLPPPDGPVTRVTPDQVDELPAIVRDAAPGTTILLEDGMYRSSLGGEAARRIQIVSEGITLRSASNDATAVTLDGQYMTNEMIFITASNVTVAHLTLMHAVDHPIHVTPPAGGPDVRGVRLYGLRILDGGEQLVKVNSNSGRDAWVDDGTLECSFFRLTDDGRPHIERSPGGCYTGGIDAHSARGWVVRQNRFEDIYCAGEGLAEHAIHFWSASRDTVVENNTIVGCARGIGFGLVESGASRPYADDPYPGVGYIGHYDGIIRNNVIYADHPYYDTGIELDQARGARVLHNTVYSTAGATGFFSSIDYRFANTQVEIRNNLVRRITQRNGAAGTVADNLEDITPDLFVDPAGVDFHLTAGAAEAIDRGSAHPDSGLDMDGEPHDHGAAPDLGADERSGT